MNTTTATLAWKPLTWTRQPNPKLLKQNCLFTKPGFTQDPFSLNTCSWITKQQHVDEHEHAGSANLPWMAVNKQNPDQRGTNVAAPALWMERDVWRRAGHMNRHNGDEGRPVNDWRGRGITVKKPGQVCGGVPASSAVGACACPAGRGRRGRIKGRRKGSARQEGGGGQFNIRVHFHKTCFMTTDPTTVFLCSSVSFLQIPKALSSKWFSDSRCKLTFFSITANNNKF